MLNIIPIPAFTDNYLWLIHNTDNNVGAIVDPGDATPVRDYCDKNNIDLRYILITHHHADHIGGIAELAGHYNTTVFGPASESIPKCDHPLTEGDLVNLPELNLELTVLDVPGHTKGHIAYVGHGWLFCGDTLFAGGCGRLFEGTPQQMHHSLAKLKSLDPSTLVFCAHEYTVANLEFALSVNAGNSDLQARIENEKAVRSQHRPTLPSSIGLELKTNPFLRSDDPEIVQAAVDFYNRPVNDEVEVFAAIRELKNSF